MKRTDLTVGTVALGNPVSYTQWCELVERFETLLDRMEGALRSNVGDGVAAGSSTVLTPEGQKYLKEAQEAADKYVKQRKWDMAKERGEMPVEADLA